jgi:hypothetical protein
VVAGPSFSVVVVMLMNVVVEVELLRSMRRG